MKIATALQTRADEFDQFATKHSDDPRTANIGGDLGPRVAGDLPLPILNALMTLREGEVSRVVETALGYHIIRRLRPSPRQTLAAREILVAAEAKPSLWFRPARDASRSRTAALEKVRAIEDALVKRHQAFPDVARSYSDVATGPYGGDIGAFSNYSRKLEPLVLAALERAEIGEVVGPIRTPDGYLLMQRTDEVSRPLLDADEIIIPRSADTDGQGLDDQKDSGESLARRLTEMLQQNPDQFDELKARHCGHPRCRQDIPPWRHGSQWIMLDEALLNTEVGAVGRAPVQTPLGFHIFRRVEPDPSQEQIHEVRFDLVAPEPLDVVELVDVIPPPKVARATAQFTDVASKRLAFRSADEKRRFRELMTNFSKTIVAGSQEQEDPAKLFATLMNEVRLVLGPDNHAVFRRILDRWAFDLQLQ